MTGAPYRQAMETEDPRRNRIRKSAEAYRTISEVADELHVPQHVLRFWETKFPRIKPLKRGGGRRYYRPDDVVLLRRIADLLYIQGYTIKGVQRLLKEGGGSLHDEIPPASDEERAAAAAERAQGSTATPAQRLDLPELPIGPTPVQGGTLSEPAAVPPVAGEDALRRARHACAVLRTALADALAEIERLRRTFGE